MDTGLGLATTFHDMGPTYYGPKGHTSRIDHIAVPVAEFPLVSHCGRLLMAAKRLQEIPGRHFRDHIPVGMIIVVKFANHGYPGKKGQEH